MSCQKTSPGDPGEFRRCECCGTSVYRDDSEPVRDSGWTYGAPTEPGWYLVRSVPGLPSLTMWMVPIQGGDCWAYGYLPWTEELQMWSSLVAWFGAERSLFRESVQIDVG